MKNQIIVTFINFFIYAFGQDCEHFASIKDGEIFYEPDNTISIPNGARATLRCYASKFETTSTCIDGNWQPPSLGYCTEESTAIALSKRQEHHSTKKPTSSHGCRALETPKNSFLTYSSLSMAPYPAGTMANLNCFLGFSPIGQTAAECQDGEWSSIGNCQPISVQRCPPIAPIAHGMINYIPGGNGPYDYGSIAELTCGFGRSVAGNNRVTCESAGWAPTPGLGHCQEPNMTRTVVATRVKRQLGIGTTGGIGCTALTVFNGQVSYIQSNPSIPYSSGSTAMLICNAGYSPSGSSSAYCSNGIWSPTLGQCTQGGLGTIGTGGLGGLGTGIGWGTGTGLMCPAIATPLSGQVQYSMAAQGFGQYSSGTTATLYCTSGTVSGSITSQCSSGMWYPPLGTCNTFGNGLGTGIGTGIGGQCTIGIMAPLGGTVQYSSGSTFGPWPQGATASLICNGGFPQGQSTSSCMNGMWNPSSFTGCSNSGGLGTGIGTGIGGTGQCTVGIMAPLGGTVQYSSGSTFGPWPQGSTASLICNGGFPQGQTTSSCMNGMWNPSTFTGCSNSGGLGTGIGTGIGGTQCYTAMPTVIGGQVTYSSGSSFGPFPSGSTATLMCTNGQLPQGQSTATCLNGMWNPSMFSGCGGNNGWGTGIGGIGTTNGQCLATLMAPLNGQIRYSTGSTFGPFASGTTATLACNQGYTPSGASSATCINGQFNPSMLGQCIMGNGLGTGIGIGGIGSTFATRETSVDKCDDSPLPLLSNGRLETTGNPEKVQVVCHEGFTSQVSEISVFCQNGEIRTRQSAACVPTNQSTGSLGSSCKAPVAHVERGQILYSTGNANSPFPSGTIATLVCEFGNQAIGGSTSATCLEGGWSQQLATCQPLNQQQQKTQCQSIAKIPGGNIAYSEIFNANGPYNEGTFATLMCDFGKTLQGSATVTCRHGAWEPTIGNCHDPASLPTSGGGSFQVAQRLHPPTARCPPIKSPSLRSTLEFDQTPLADGNYPNSTIARLICLEDDAEIIHGVSEAECIKGIWLPKLGECSPAKKEETEKDKENKTHFRGPGTCQPIEPPSKGKISYIQSGPKNTYQVGSTAILNCDIGYSVSGHAALSCAPDGSWLPSGGFGKCLSNTDLVH